MLIHQKKYSPLLFFVFIFLFKITATAQLLQCKAVLKNDTLVLENSKIKRVFGWHNGSLQNISVYNKITHRLISSTAASTKADVFFPGITGDAVKGTLSVYDVPGNNSNYEYRAVEIMA